MPGLIRSIERSSRDLRNNRHRAGQWLPAVDHGRRAAEYDRWRRAVGCAVLFSRPYGQT